MMRIFLTGICLMAVLTVRSQFNETIRSGRPGHSIGAFTLGQGIFQIQTGFDFFGSSALNSSSHGVLNNTVLRYGLTETFELSTELDYKKETVVQDEISSNQSGLDALDVGMRYHIYTGKGLIPNVGFQFRVRLPYLGKDYEIKDVAPRFILVLSQQLHQFNLVTNWGALWNGNDSSPEGVYTINLSYPFNSKIGAFVENYGSLSKGVLTAYVDTGLAWLVNNDLQLDLLGGYGNNYGLRSYFVSTGVSWRTKRK